MRSSPRIQRGLVKRILFFSHIGRVVCYLPINKLGTMLLITTKMPENDLVSNLRLRYTVRSLDYNEYPRI